MPKTSSPKRCLAALLAIVLTLSMLPAISPPAAAAPASGSTDVWDFGAEALEGCNNLLTADIINSWYGSDVSAGSASVNLPSFTVNGADGEADFVFNDGGFPKTHRLRTTNTALTHYDAKSLTFGDTTYTGYLYCNKSATSDVYVGIRLQQNDILTLCVSSNGNKSTVTMESPSGEKQQQVYDASDKGTVMTFYAPEAGMYKIYSADEKLVLARASRTHPGTTALSGDMTAPAGFPAGASLVFTNDETGNVTQAPLSKTASGWHYEAELHDQYSYSVSLADADGYILSSDDSLTLAKGETSKTADFAVQGVSLVTVTGKLLGLSPNALSKVQLSLEADAIYQPTLTISDDAYTAVLESGVSYQIKVENIGDYTLSTPTALSATTDSTQNITFAEKTKYPLSVTLTGTDDQTVDSITFTNLKEEGYVYPFSSLSAISLRDGVYSVTVQKEGYTQLLTSNLSVSGAAASKTIPMQKIETGEKTPYKAKLTVAKDGSAEYETVNAALNAVRQMDRQEGQTVTITIAPGNYEEMLVIDVPDVTLQNASDSPSLSVTNQGVDIAPQAVRITSYYGHGYHYFSQGTDGKYSAAALAVNKENGYPSYENPGAGTTNDSYWNATVVVTADHFSADGIIFENSFNQYISDKEAADVVVEAAGSKGDRESLPAHSTAVQDKPYVERAAALAVAADVNQAYFDRCKFIGRQDTLYGGAGTTAAFNQCDILGGTDYIFGGMTAVFFKCNLTLNTSDDTNDVAYITAAQQTTGRGYLLYNCNINSTTPGDDSASAAISKPGYFGRPWAANTGEAVYYYTVVDKAADNSSLIVPAGWNSTLSGESARCCEYGTYERVGVDNSGSRASWASTLQQPKLPDGTDISIAAFLGDWKPFAAETLDITLPDGTQIPSNEPSGGAPSPQRTWNFSTYGSSINTTDNDYSENGDGSVSVWSVNGKGKLVPLSTDGLAFYYTALDPATENFVLKATVTVDNWKLSNGQEGFGLMASDAVGVHGDGASFWNNSYMASVTKTSYYWDSEKNALTDDATKAQITMKLGIGAQEKKGVTPANVADGTAATTMQQTMTPLETLCAAKGAGTYNIIGNYTDNEPTGTTDQTLTTFDLQIQRDNTGYSISYTDAAGKTTTKRYYDLDRNALTQIDPDHIYVGFFAARNAKLTAQNISLTTSDPKTDPPAEEKETTYITPSYQIVSATETGETSHTLIFRANADGALSIQDSKGANIVSSKRVQANTSVNIPTQLTSGDNKYTVIFLPDADYIPGPNQKLSSYDPAQFTHTVRCQAYGRTNGALYVAPNGDSKNAGTKQSPLDIYTAVKYVRAGQKIVLAGGNYALTKTVHVTRGTDGTEASPIYMIADPEATERPVLDFGSHCAGMVLEGNHWYYYGFDVTRSQDAQKGIQLSGSYCTLDRLGTYRNGNTGLQISRYREYDGRELWPHDNLILNCTSYLNADKGYEDADGFAAKLTVGSNNVFDGCIAAYNADDGWDLFAKVETGAIGQVTIRNSIAFKNGYVIAADGSEIAAGNGNGFKLGGSSITGYHQLIGSVAYDNKGKGIDCNSCPDVQVKQSTSFNNGEANVAFYTTDATTTDFSADGILSFRKGTNTGENIKPRGTQDLDKIYGPTNYYWDETTQSSFNTAHTTVADDWFVSLDTSIRPTRNNNGTLQRNGLLELTQKTPQNTGARPNGTSSLNTSTLPLVYGSAPSDNNGSSDGNGAGDGTGTGSGTSWNNPFTDVAENAWYYDAIKYTYENHILLGTAANRFAPEGVCTRAMFVTVLYRMAGSPTSASVSPFTDVPANTWYTQAVAWANANKITTGVSATAFDPNGTLTREQTATFLYRYAVYQKEDVSGSTSLDRFSDSNQVATWAQSAMRWAVSQSIIEGKDTTTLAPRATATRAEIAALMSKYMQR